MPNTSRNASKPLAWFSLLLAATTVVMLLMGYRSQVGPFVIGSLTCFALFCMRHPSLKSYAFTVWVFTFVAGSMFSPVAFMTWAGFDLGKLISPLIQIIMFGMGTTLSIADFSRVLRIPWPVFIGFAGQFTIMPLVGLGIATLFGFEPAVAAGVVLIGSTPGGVASNVMTYLAGGDVALSVTMTACSTLASPFMTPFLMDRLAGKFIEVNFLSMMLDIINMIIVPIVAGLLANRILYSRGRLSRNGRVLALIGTTAVLAAAAVVLLVPPLVLQRGDASFKRDGFIVGLLLIGVVTLAQLVIRVWRKGPERWMDKALPVVSMAAICFIIAIITARSAEKLIKVGPYLIGAAMIHNAVGYLLGYWLARVARLGQTAARTVSIEVGMQNGGMASALAMNVLHSPDAALAPAIFGPWMNISASILATWWRRKPVETTRPVGSYLGTP